MITLSKMVLGPMSVLLCCCVSLLALKNQEESRDSFDLKTHPKASLLPLDSCGQDQSDRIWEGSELGVGEFPWYALLQYRGSNVIRYKCGGVLISKRYVLTAAHCLLAVSPISSLSKVRLGEYNLDSDQDCETDAFSGRLQCAPAPQDFGTEEVIIHPEYTGSSRNHHHDIGLVRLDRDVKLDTPYVQPICLPTVEFVEAGQELLVVGFGSTSTNTSSSVKLKVEVPVVSPEKCLKIYATMDRDIGDGQLCAGGVNGRDSCRGDSGGPLMNWTGSLQDGTRRYNVVGLVSYGLRPCGGTQWPSVYTKVFKYIPWILENIQPSFSCGFQITLYTNLHLLLTVHLLVQRIIF